MYLGFVENSKNFALNDFTTIEYLRNGNQKQQRCYELLRELQIFEKLKKYTPILTGTIPIEIDTDQSDLDIICCANDYHIFDSEVKQLFENEAKFSISKPNESTCANFWYKGMEIEIYANPTPVFLQNAYRHMLVEYRLLHLLGEDFKRKIVKLKADGMKTEPAFAYVLNLSGDNPYQELLNFESLTDEEIWKILKIK